MKLKYPYLSNGLEPIDNKEKYLVAQNRFHKAREEWIQLNDQLLKLPLDKRSPKFMEEIEQKRLISTQLLYENAKRTPIVMISICPYCGQEVWAGIGIYSLTDNYWYLKDSDSRDGSKETICEHLFCIDGALNLNGQQPTEAFAPVEAVSNQSIHMAAGVPFVKPRVLNLPTMVAVVHSFPIAEKYTAYPIVYFAQEMPPQDAFCIGWARAQYVDFHEESNRKTKNTGRPKAVMIGEREDAQDYNLQKWVEKGKLFWVDPVSGNKVITGEKFPYADVIGKKHPYMIHEGQVTDLPNPKDNKPKIRLEW